MPSKLVLPDVTLVAATSVALPATVAALQASMAQVEFAEVLLFTDRPPSGVVNPAIVWRPIGPMRSRADFSRFMLKELAAHVRTSHALCVQWDGFVLNGQAWDPHFLEFDYIGAVWPHFADGHNVGNGGFSLRSARLLRECVHLPFDGAIAEDMLIARQCRSLLEAKGIRFAPADIARRFSYERDDPKGTEFGFHGAFNLIRMLSPADALKLFGSLELGVMARSEHLELLRWAVGRRRWRLAASFVRRMIETRVAQRNAAGA